MTFDSVSAWKEPPPKLDCGARAVHVWRTRLDVSAHELERRLQTLSQDEVIRASRFVFRRDREHYIAARGFLRVLLGRYVRRDPQSLRFVYNDYGKPALAHAGPRGPEFNVSHSGDWALVAVSNAPTVGIDVERVRADFDPLELAEGNFADGEKAALARAPREERATMFFNCWTQKEALVKAVGEGLSIPLDTFEVRLVGEPGLRSIDVEGERPSGWFFCSADPAPGYLGVLAAKGSTRDVQYFDGSNVRAAPQRRVADRGLALAGA